MCINQTNGEEFWIDIEFVEGMKLTLNQIKALKVFRMYPNSIVMNSGYLTSGHGVKFDKRTLNGLWSKKLVSSDGRLTELGKTIELKP